MGKIQDAIRKATDQSRAGRSEFDIDGRRIEHGEYKLLPRNDSSLVSWRLRPGVRHEPSIDVLRRNCIGFEAFSDEVLTRYKMLRTKIRQQCVANGWTTLGVTAPRAGAGTTTTAINLAITLASHGAHDVALLDMNLRDSSIADYLGIPQNSPGLGAYLEGDLKIADVLWDVGIENLCVLANRDRLGNSSDQITSARMREVIDMFRKYTRNPILICDLPPVLTADDAIAIAPMVDAFLLVTSEGETSRDDLYEALEALADTNLAGVVLNKKNRR